MATYIIRRIIQMVPVLLIVTFIVFIIFRVIPGDPLMFILGSNPDPETIKIVSNHPVWHFLMRVLIYIPLRFVVSRD